MRRIQNYVVNKSPSFFQKLGIRRKIRKKRLRAEKIAKELIKIVIKDSLYLALNCRFDENCDMVDSDSDDDDDSKDSDSIRYYYDI